MGTIKEVRDMEEKVCSFLESLNSALLYSELCWAASNFSLLHKTKHRKTPHGLADLPVGFPHTILPNLWDLVCSWRELHRQSPPTVPETPCPAMVSESLSRLHWTERAPGSCPHLIKGLVFSTFCEGINIVGHRAVNIKGSADLACSGTGSSVALSLQYSAKTSPGVYKTLLLLLTQAGLVIPNSFTLLYVLVLYLCPLDTLRDFFTGSDEEGSSCTKPFPWTTPSAAGSDTSLPCFPGNKRVLLFGPY